MSGHILYTSGDAMEADECADGEGEVRARAGVGRVDDDLEAIDDGLWNILYYNTLLGRLSERSGKISGASFRSDER